MPLVAVHCLPIAPFNVMGVWLSPVVSSYLFIDGRPSAVTTGQHVMRTMGSGIDWDEWCRHLEDARTTTALWRAVPRGYGEEARHVLARVAATEAVERRESSR